MRIIVLRCPILFVVLGLFSWLSVVGGSGHKLFVQVLRGFVSESFENVIFVNYLLVC